MYGPYLLPVFIHWVKNPKKMTIVTHIPSYETLNTFNIKK